jgi:hypothetical protein
MPQSKGDHCVGLAFAFLERPFPRHDTSRIRPMTTSADTTKQEIVRFLKNSEPGVLCINGAWGVGKTFLWRQVLAQLRKAGGLSFTRYSYVSLFGLNSLDDLKSAMFENMEWLDQDATSFAQRGKAGAKALAARAKKLSELAGALPWVGQAFTKSRSLYFSLIQDQIVCIDDLDRRSDHLDVKDVLGLISFLREQRGCKVALILNAKKLGDGSEQFENLLEKVIEEKVILAPTAIESATIALEGKSDLLSLRLKSNCESLGIRNIRVIKQIERIVRRVDEFLPQFSQAVRDQATNSLTLYGWSKYDRENSIRMDFLKTSPLERHLARGDQDETESADEAAWDSLLAKYNYGHADDFDLTLLNYVDTMILDIEAIQNEARKLQEQQRLSALHGTLEAAWRPFHDSFADNEDEVVSALFDGNKTSFEVVSLPNLNVAVGLLKELGRNNEASELLKFFAENISDAGYWTFDDPFERGPFDSDVSAIIETKTKQQEQELDLATDLIKAGKDYNVETIKRLATIPVEAYRDLILASSGEQLRSIILSALEFRRIANASDDMRRVKELMEEALRMLGRRSLLNELRIKKYGVSV